MTTTRSIVILFFCALTPLAQAQEEWEWTEGPSLNLPRAGHCAAATGGKIFVFGGATRMEHMELTGSIEVFDPIRNSWSDAGRLPRPLSQAAAVAYGRYILLFGGLTEGGANLAILRYDVQTGRIEERGRLPEPRYGMGGARVGRRVMLMGGVQGRQDVVRTGYFWDPDSGRWAPAPPMNSPSTNFGMASDGSIWAVGGIYFGPLNRVETFRDTAWVNVPRAELPEARGELGVAFFGDTLMVAAGGAGRRGLSSDVWAFDFWRGEWIDLPSLRSGRSSFSLIELNGKLYAIGGAGRGAHREQGGALDEVWVLSRPNSATGALEPPARPTLLPTPLWPSPANGWFAVAPPQGAISLRIVDVSGRLVYSSPLSGGDHFSVDAARFPTGAYAVLLFDQYGQPLGEARAVILR